MIAALAILVRFSAPQRVGLDVYVRDTYHAIPLRVVGFWSLLGVAAIWFVIAAIRFSRRPS